MNAHNIVNWLWSIHEQAHIMHDIGNIYLDVLLWDGYLGGENHHSIQCWFLDTQYPSSTAHYSDRVVLISSDF